jgi:hypothetical protein
MHTDRYNRNEKSGFSEIRGRSSKTVRKFTAYFSEDALPQAVSVTLDWLTFMCEYIAPAPDPEHPVTWPTGDVAMEYTKKGTPVFNYSFNLFMDGEPVAKLHTCPKNEKIMVPGTAKLEILNQVLYSTTWLQTVQTLCHALGITYIKNISRMDIAIDGANHVHKFLNGYAWGHSGGKELQRRGSYIKMLGKAAFQAGMKDKKNGVFNHFKIGRGHKQFVVYNKTQELQRSHKEYIRDAWKKAGMDTEGEQWRCELRMTSQAIKQIRAKSVKIVDIDGNEKVGIGEGIDLDRLADPNYLLMLFRVQIKNFMEFIVVEGDSNVSRSRVIDLFQFHKLKVPLLDKVPRVIINGAYKAKMAIHMGFMNLCRGIYKTDEQVNTILNFITDTVQMYQLNRFYEKKKPDWIAAYVPAAH